MLEWIKQRFLSFDLFPDYFRLLVGNWQNVLWGTSLAAVAFALWWFLGVPPTWAIATFLTCAMLIAGYYTWRADHVRLVPRLIVGDARIISTPTTNMRTGEAGADRVFAQIEIQNPTDTTLADCRGHLLRVMRWSEAAQCWESTAVDESLALLWSTIDQPATALYPRMRRQLCLFYVEDVATPHIHIWAATVQHRMVAFLARSDPTDVLRFDISITAQDCPAVNVSLRVQLGTDMDNPEVSVMPREAIGPEC